MGFLHFRLNLMDFREKNMHFNFKFSDFFNKWNKRSIDQFLVNR